MGRLVTRLAVAATSGVLLAGGLSACGGDTSSNDSIDVEVGEEFTWNGFTVQEGWELSPIETSIGVNDILVSPQVNGSVTNDRDEERAPIFAMRFSKDGEWLATLSCSAMKLTQGQSGELVCRGLGQEMPLDHDTVTVTKFVRNDGMTGAPDSDSDA